MSFLLYPWLHIRSFIHKKRRVPVCGLRNLQDIHLQVRESGLINIVNRLDREGMTDWMVRGGLSMQFATRFAPVEEDICCLLLFFSFFYLNQGQVVTKNKRNPARAMLEV